MKIDNIISGIIKELQDNIVNEIYQKKSSKENINAFLNEDFIMQTEIIRSIIIDNQLIDQEFLPYINYNKITRDIIDELM